MSVPAITSRKSSAPRLKIPAPNAPAGRRALRAIIKSRSVLPALSVFHEELGDIFQISLGAFKPVFMVGPKATRFVLVTGRDALLWRPQNDPVADLLRSGLLVTDGEKHDRLRRTMNPALHRKRFNDYQESMWRNTDRVMLDWSTAYGPVDMLVEMRKIALVIVMDALFRVDMLPDLHRILPAIVDVIRYISPGLWTLWPRTPRVGFRRSIQTVDNYLYKIISERRAAGPIGDDLLSVLAANPEMDDDLVRDQLLTLLIAGHDTSTALLSWALYLLAQHPDVYEKVRHEVDIMAGDNEPTEETVSEMTYLGQVVDETLRLYPPIHIGNRIAAADIDFEGHRIPAGTRVVYSIYLTHRHRDYWREPDRFDPDRFSADRRREIVPYSFVPFGGGPRNCIGAAFAQVEAKIVLCRILQRFDVELANGSVRPHMGATLEPYPRVPMRVHAIR